MSRKLHLYRIRQNVNNGYHTYAAAVVPATSEYDARSIHPDSEYHPEPVPASEDESGNDDDYPNDWCWRENVKVEYVGEPRHGMRRGVICASFNAG
ncbi:MAG: hypothetical protein WCS18_12245 [Sphaerochaetaceae bacterium]